MIFYSLPCKMCEMVPFLQIRSHMQVLKCLGHANPLPIYSQALCLMHLHIPYSLTPDVSSNLI